MRVELNGWRLWPWGILIARTTGLETTQLKDLVRMLTYNRPLETSGLFTRYARTREGVEGVTRRNYPMSDMTKAVRMMAEMGGIPFHDEVPEDRALHLFHCSSA